MYHQRNTLKLALWILLASFQFHQITTGLFARAKRTCRNRTANLFDIETDIILTTQVIVSNGSYELFLKAEWTVNFSSLGGEVPLDGFAVHFLTTDERYDHSIPNHPIAPTTPCISNPGQFWVATEEDSACQPDGNSTECQGYPGFCLCPTVNCTLLPNPVPCKGILEFFEYPDFYQTVPSTVRSLLYRIDFHEKYDFSIIPYYREYAGYPKTEQIFEDDCTGLLKRFMSTRLAETLCCEQGYKNLVARDIHISEPRPTFRSNVNKTTVNVTISWLSPGAGSVIGYSIHIGNEGEEPWTNARRTNQTTVAVTNGSAASNVTACNAAPLYSNEVELYNLVPGNHYRFVITAIFNDTELQKWCSEARCTTRVVFEAKEPYNLCEEEFNLCAANATCFPVLDTSTKRNATCVCEPGLTGDGVAGEIGTGCKELDHCSTEENVCAEFARCTNRPAPNTGVNCTCKDGYDGDGLADGSGCRSRVVMALAIALPLVAVLIIAVVVGVWYIRKRRKEKRDALFAQYITDLDNGILMSYLNSDTKEEQGPWDPTFGQKWEIDRKNINFGKVLGRGNYGVVHFAWLLKDDLRSGIGNVRNGDLYSPVISNETGEELSSQVDITVVAVKSLQESSRNHENVANFLAEIGFILNVGSHENILKIYGCSTTEEPVYMVTEYLQYGDLLHFLWDARDASKAEADPIYKVTELSLCTMARHVANGMSYLQHIRVIHGDIAARNILVGEGGICKISDFGLANDVYIYGAIKGHKEKFVPFKWISPERMMSGHVPITCKSDVWSYGNLMYEMFTLGCPPHPGINANELLEKLRSGYRMAKPETCNDQAFELMNKCWRWRASSRPAFAQIVKILDTLIFQLQEKKSQLDVVRAVEDLDAEQYANELRLQPSSKENEYVNGNIALVENELDSESRAM